MKYFFVFLSSIFLVQVCSPQLQQRFISEADIQRVPNNYEDQQRPTKARKGPCYDANNYAPDPDFPRHTPMKYIRINYHFINSSDSLNNFNGEEAQKFARQLTNSANGAFHENKKMYLPIGNDTPVLPLRFKYKLMKKEENPEENAVYCRYDDNPEVCYYVHRGKNRNIGDRRVINKYAIQKDTILNIFIMPHHPDSVASKTYDNNGVGVAMGTVTKIAGPFATKKPYWRFKGTLNHEIGHIFTLHHTWKYNDGCDDTPKNPNCFNKNVKPGCDTLTSNNVMDYNAWQSAWTPCQIGRVHLSMAKENSRQRKLLEPTWCELKANRHIRINTAIEWNCMKDLDGHLTIEAGGELTMRCRTSLPKGAKITVEPDGKLILDNTRLHNACGDEWQGIEIQEYGNQKGEVIFIGDVKLENVVHELK